MKGLGNENNLFMLRFLLVLALVLSNEAAFLFGPTGPPKLTNPRKYLIPKEVSLNDLDKKKARGLSTPTSIESISTRSSPQTTVTPGSASPSPRVYTPSQPIPINHSKESFQQALIDYAERGANDPYDNCGYLDPESSDFSSDSSENDSESEMFAMSYEPGYAEFLRLRNEERRLKKELKQKAKKEEKERLKKTTFTLLKSDVTGSPEKLVYQDLASEEQKFLERYQAERRKKYALKNVELKSDNDTDSDFGENAPKKEEFSVFEDFEEFEF